MKSMGILIAALALAACATNTSTPTASAAQGDRDCFRAASVNGYNVVDDRHVQLSVGANRRYILTTDWSTRELDWTHAIALRSDTGFICTGNGLEARLIGGEPQQTYFIRGIERAPDQVPGSEGS